MLKQRVAYSVGSVVTWVQQQAEQQLSDLNLTAVDGAGNQEAASITRAAGSASASLWAAGVHLLGCLAAAALAHASESAGACSLAASLTQQLDQSGKVGSGNC
jgi:hypothetical protein